MLISIISKMFSESDCVKIYTYDNKISIYGIYFSNIEIRKIYRVILDEGIKIELTNTSNKVCIDLIMGD